MLVSLRPAASKHLECSGLCAGGNYATTKAWSYYIICNKYVYNTTFFVGVIQETEYIIIAQNNTSPVRTYGTSQAVVMKDPDSKSQGAYRILLVFISLKGVEAGWSGWCVVCFCSMWWSSRRVDLQSSTTTTSSGAITVVAQTSVSVAVCGPEASLKQRELVVFLALQGAIAS